MSLFSRLLGRSPSVAGGAMAVNAGDLIEVVGESHRQDALRRLARVTTTSDGFVERLSGRARRLVDEDGDRRWFEARLEREPTNPVDSNAIKVSAEGIGLLGYLSRDDAIDYQVVFNELDRRGCSVATCPAFLIGGEPGKPSYGVLLCLSSPELICNKLGS